MKRFQISFSKGKAKKVKKLASRNQELQEILGYSERIVPIADTRKSSEPVALFEKIRQHACVMHNALMRNWKCCRRSCRTHQANLCLQAETKTVSFIVLFVVEDDAGSSRTSRRHEITIEPIKSVERPLVPSEQIKHVQQAESFTLVQNRFNDMELESKTSKLKTFFGKAAARPRSSPKDKKQARVSTPPPAVTISEFQTNSQRTVTSITKGEVHSRRVSNLCSSLRDCPDTILGIIDDEYDRHFEILKPIGPSLIAVAPATAKMVPLPTILDAYHQAKIEIARHEDLGWLSTLPLPFYKSRAHPGSIVNGPRTTYFSLRTLKSCIATTHTFLENS